MPAIENNAELKYIPQLNLYYDEVRNVYLDESGCLVNYGRRANDMHDYGRRATDVQEPSLHSMKFDLATVIKVIGITTAIVGQYYMFDDKVKSLSYEIQSAKKDLDIFKENLTETQHNITNLSAQQSIQLDVLNNMQIKLATMKK